MNRFVFLFMAFFSTLSCKEEEVICVSPVEDISGNALLGISSMANDTLKGILLSPTELIETPICNPEALSGFDTSSPPISLDSAVLDHCQSCLLIYQWSGPGCNPAYEANEEETPLLATLWNFDHLVFQNDKYYDNCLRPFHATFHEENWASFSLGNQYSTPFEVTDGKILFEKDPVQTLRFVEGYERDLEIIFESLFSETPVQIALTGNRLMLTHESGTQFIFYAE